MKNIMTAAIIIIVISIKVSYAQSFVSVSDSTLTDTLPAYDVNLQPVNAGQARPFPYPKLRSENVRMYARVWRIIDLTDTANTILTIPGHSLMETIMQGLNEGKLTPYERDDFKKKITVKQGEARFADSVLVQKFDKDGNEVSSRMMLNEFNPDNIKKFRIEEDVFFDRQRGRVDTRIIAIAPMMNISTSANLPDNMSTAPAFWLYFPQLRYALIKVDLSDPDKNVFDITMDDVFMQHKFSAYLVKEFTPGGTQTDQLDPGSPEAIKLEQKIAELKKHIWQNPKGINDKNLIQQSNKKEDKQ
ncbi:gliding motility associated protien GldN [Mucilaginibacter mallensis]|uniref:Gliding motility associated protien GldN n=1 Tax=Mucilaginibacter mallensis TaxID=652787 RepID=A0A1H1PS55_MUCMA|nr:gliding motility protein GldN [Mucilaginibacter mallensis]SDS13936.1 gliding motility associated protien GldN [Mucilaginibacter mallensis]